MRQPSDWLSASSPASTSALTRRRYLCSAYHMHSLAYLNKANKTKKTLADWFNCAWKLPWLLPHKVKFIKLIGWRQLVSKVFFFIYLRDGNTLLLLWVFLPVVLPYKSQHSYGITYSHTSTRCKYPLSHPQIWTRKKQNNIHVYVKCLYVYIVYLSGAGAC